MTPIQTNKHVFFDDEGNILEGGSIWIGQPNTDPRTNPKTVTFTDAGGSTFTAQQPLKTKAGRIVYNGKPIEATVDGEHSMLVFDSSGKQTDYYRSINAGGSGGEVADFNELIRVGLTLDDVKAFNVSVGDTVQNVGKELPTDGLGKQWLAVSNTGGSADDETLIDFNNGLQGREINFDPTFRQETVSLGGDFTAPNDAVLISRIGNTVTITCATAGFAHPSNATPDSAPGAIPSWARPTALVKTLFGWSVPFGHIIGASITDSGNFGLIYLDESLATQSYTSASGFTISYVVEG